MESKRVGTLAGIAGLAIVLAFLLLGGGIGVAMYNGIFWVGVVLLAVAACVAFFGANTWSALTAWLMVAGLILLIIGWFASTSAIWVGAIALIAGAVLFWRLRAQIEAKPAGR